MKDQTDPDSIIGRYEIAKILGVSRQGVASVLNHPDFPPPICTIGANKAPIFYRRGVESFAAEREAAAQRDAVAPAAA